MNALAQIPPRPQNPAVLFEESQHFTQWWIWALTLIPMASGAAAIFMARWPHGHIDRRMLVLLPVFILVPAMIGFADLQVTVTPGWLHLRFTPFFVDKHISLAE